jgi:hypothetical protein
MKIMEELGSMPAGAQGAIGGILAVYGIIIILIIASMWKIFTKAGHEGWKCLIPIYNLYILTKIVEKPGYWVVLMIIPYVNLIFLIWTYNLLSKKFGKGVGFTLGLVFLGAIFFPILAFGSAEYEGADVVSEGDVLDEA